jgi:hypothetical protein
MKPLDGLSAPSQIGQLGQSELFRNVWPLGQVLSGISSSFYARAAASAGRLMRVLGATSWGISGTGMRDPAINIAMLCEAWHIAILKNLAKTAR